MKAKYISFLFAASFYLFIPLSGWSTTPDLSKWIRNISEGEGATPIGMSDYGPEMLVSGKTLHFLWMTNNNWVTKDLYYRRSPDGGTTWEAKKLLLSSAGLDDVVRSPKMYVSGSYVHIAYINKNGTGSSELYYLRSVDGGASFETPRLLYSIPQNMTELRVKGDGPYLTIASVHNCWYCADVNIIHFFNSDNNGDTFDDRTVPGNFNTWTFSTWDVAVEGPHIYFLALEPTGSNYEYNLHLFSSDNRGVSFRDNIISVPSQNGLHHPFGLMDYNWGYARKMATDGERVWVIWSGLNAENKERIFVAGSSDGGNTFSPTQEISGTIEGFQRGQETITITGDEIYATFLKADSKIFIVKSHNSGASFEAPYAFTLPNDQVLRAGWGPILIPDPIQHNAYLIHNGPVVGLLTPDSDYPRQDFIGNAAIRDQRYVVAAFDNEGILHIAFAGGGVWLSTGVFTDHEIFYRSVDPGFTSATQEDNVLSLAAFENAGDGSGKMQFDKMIISPYPDMKFTSQMTIEVWLKPETDRLATYISQNHSGTLNQGQVGGFILWSDGYQAHVPVTNIVTTSGLYPMSSSRKLKAHVWNHLAVTYDKDGGAQNFRMYLNGQVVASTTAAGDIITPDVTWIVGAMYDNYYRSSFEGQLDEIRFWNVARTQDEIRQNFYTKFTGDEPGLVAYYNFNAISPEGQVEDVTGNGHTGYLIYKEESQPSTLKDIGVRFEYIQSGSDFYFTQKTSGGQNFEWTFGDTKSSTEVNPVHTYLNPGTFQVCLMATGQENSGTYCETVVVKGIDRVFPNSGGNTGGITLNVFGGGFAANSEAILRKAGLPDIAALKNIYDPAGIVTAVFDLNEKTIGDWDVVIKTSASEMILPKGFKIVPGEKAQPWVKYLGGGTILAHRWTPQTIVVGNSANVDAYGVVLWVAVPNDPDFDILFLNLNVKKPQIAIDHGYADQLDAFGLYSVVDTLFGKPSDSRLYSFYLPYVPAKSTMNISVRVRTKQPVKQRIQVAVSAPFYASPLSAAVQGCIGFAAVKACIKAGLGFIPGIPCITGALSVVSDYAGDNPPTPSSFENIDVKSFGWNIGTSLLECASSIGAPVIAGVLSIITSSIEAKQENDDCLRGFWPSPISLFQIDYFGVSSLDPNEKKGSAGYGIENFIPVTGQLSYQILFENKVSATAPAQEVVVTDTLHDPLYDLKNFSFGPVSFGENIFYPIPNAYEFGLESDLRPEKNAIVRMTGQLDTLSRVIRWHFITLDPITRDLIADPLGGFLPPNATSPEGEGYVTMSVGLKEVGHMDEVQNKANIIFDLNPVIVTNDFFNTFDMEAPQSRLLTDTQQSTDTTLTIYTEGTDDGSGIRLFEIYVSDNGLPYELYQYTSSDSFSFTGLYGHVYRLYSVAVDSVGNMEEIPEEADIEVSVVTGVSDVSEWRGVKVYPNPAGNTFTVEFTLQESNRIHCGLYDMQGRLVRSLFSDNLPVGNHHMTLETDVSEGCYVLKVSTAKEGTHLRLVIAR